jgi:nicotinamide-nucleotide amidase
MRVEVVTIGDELLLGFTIDTNAAYFARALAAEGIEVVRRTTCGDTAQSIAEAVGDALSRTGAVITTGGLGPTSDDVTKPSIAALFGREMVLDEEHLEWMRERWRTRFQREMPESNIQQAMLPSGATKLRNNHGSAPGIWLEDEQGRWVAMFPGVPREARGMLADTLLPRLRDRMGAGERRVVKSRTLRTTGIGESNVADIVRDMAIGDVELAYLPSADGTDLRLTVRNVTAIQADERLGHAAEALRGALAEYIYGEDATDLAEVVLSLAREKGLSIAVAESCTGGLLGARLTAIPGSSDVMRGGVIAYHNDIKQEMLGVPEALIAEHGAVSEPVVRAMATGGRAGAAADVCLAITGVAGPGGGTPEKPVGTVWVALDHRGDVQARRFAMIGDRAEIRHRSAQAAMEMLRRQLLKS